MYIFLDRIDLANFLAFSSSFWGKNSSKNWKNVTKSKGFSKFCNFFVDFFVGICTYKFEFLRGEKGTS